MSKRNKEIARRMGGGTSPWKRYNKRPYIYSPAYYSWFRALTGKVRQESING